MKKCGGRRSKNCCGLLKNESEFSRDESRLDGLNSCCRSCENARVYRWKLQSPKKSKFLQLRNHAKRRGLPLEITIDQYWGIVSEAACYYCGGDLPEYGYGLDRADSAIGYTIGNLVPCCTRCNVAKGAYFTHYEMKLIWDLRLAKVAALLTSEPSGDNVTECGFRR